MEGAMQVASTGGRRLSHAALAARKLALEHERSVTRKELSAAGREAEKALSLRPTLRLVLSELIACWGEQTWNRLLVWPSNEYLVSRTGLSERAIRFALRALIELQLIIPKDSPNGKRYAVKDLAGEVVDAFGFDLTPIYARRGEWLKLVVEQKQLREVRKRAFDEVTICRRAAEEALSALAQHFPDIDRSTFEEQLQDLIARTPRRSASSVPEGLLEAWQLLRSSVEEAFYRAGNDGIRFRHKNLEKESLSEACNKGSPERAAAVVPNEPPEEHLSPAWLIETCPALSDYDRPIRDVADIVAAARYLRASIGTHESAWREAVECLGPVAASIAVIYVLQLHADDVASGKNRIHNPGGYFRALVRMIGKGKFDLKVELLALRRRRMS
jgi:replication initiation protein RepC